jgi:hypothetical protein
MPGRPDSAGAARAAPAWRTRLLEVLFPALLATLQLGVFGPYTIYRTNLEEFNAGFGGLVMQLLPAILTVVGALLAIGLVLPRGLFRRYVVFLFAVGVLLWVQGNLLVADYGPLDGTTIDWSAFDDRTPYEVGLWVVVALVAVLAARTVFPAAVFGSRVFLGLQAALLVITMAQTDHPHWRGPSDAMVELSRTRNAFHLVLDSFQSDAFLDIANAERAEMDRGFSGFVFYADHAGAFPTTMVSIPAMLTGSAYRNEKPIPEYMSTHFAKGSLFRALRAQQYRVDSITEMNYDRLAATRHYRMPRPYVSYDEYARFAAWQLADLSLFRHVPHALRPAVHNEQKWRLQALFGEGTSGHTVKRSHHSANGEAVLADFARRMVPAVDQPVYKFIHVGIPHLPVVLTANCDFVGPSRFSRESYGAQVRCGVTRVQGFLDRLRALNLYDSSLIVISSDHGVKQSPRQFDGDRPMPSSRVSDIAGRAMALLMVKPPDATGPLRISYAPTSLTDIPATILDALGLPKTLPGESALTLDERAPRERSFAHYTWEDGDWGQTYFDYLDIFRISGPLRDGRSWTLVNALYRPGFDPTKRTRGLAEPHRSRTGVVYRWSEPIFHLHAPPEARGFEMTVKSIAEHPQEMTLHVGEVILDRVKLPRQQSMTIRQRLPEEARRTNGWLEVRVDPPFQPYARSSQRLGVQVHDLKWIGE